MRLKSGILLALLVSAATPLAAQDAAPKTLEQIEPDIDAVRQATGREIALNGAIGGLGVALLPDYMASTATAAGQLVRLSDQGWEPPQAYYLRCPDWKAELVVFQRFREWLLAVADGQKPAA